MRRLGLALLLAGATVTALGCTATTATSGSECAVWLPISWSDQDTEQTILEIKANNARRDAWCAERVD